MTRTETVEVRLPKWQWRFLATILVIVVGAVASGLYGSIQAPYEARIAAQQLQDNPEAYAATRTWAAVNLLDVIRGIMTVAIAGIWIPFALKVRRYYKAKQE